MYFALVVIALLATFFTILGALAEWAERTESGNHLLDAIDLILKGDN